MKKILLLFVFLYQFTYGTTHDTVTIKPSGGDYATLSGAIAGYSHKDLIADDRDIAFKCFAMADGAATVSGYHTGASNRISILTDATGRHVGIWSAAKYYMTSNAFAGTLIIQDSFVTITGLQIKNTYTSSNGKALYVPAGGYINNLVDACLITADPTNGSAIRLLGGIDTIRNSVMFGSNNGVSVSGSTSIFQNCCFVNNYQGTNGTTSTMTLKNCYSSASNDDYNYATTTTWTNCMEAGTNTHTGVTKSIAYNTSNFTNVTANSENLMPPSGSSLIGQGTTLSFTNDILSHTRVVPWDVGAFSHATDYDTVWCVVGTTGSVSPASRADSSTASNRNLTFTASSYSGYSFITWKSKHSNVTFLNGSATTPVCSLTIISLAVKDTIYDSLLALPAVPILGSYNQSFIIGVAVDSVLHPDTVANTGGAATSWTSLPALPTGLAFRADGVIYGTPTATTTSDSAADTVIAINAGGRDSTIIWLKILPQGSVWTIDSISVDTLGNYTLTVIAGAGGTVRHASVTDSLSQVFQDTATPAEHYVFTGWTLRAGGAVTSNTAAGTFRLLGNDTADATFHNIQMLLTMSASGPGSVTPATGPQDSGTVFAIVATPAAHYAFTSWSVSGGAHVTSASSATTTAWMTAAGTITAVFSMGLNFPCDYLALGDADADNYVDSAFFNAATGTHGLFVCNTRSNHLRPYTAWDGNTPRWTLDAHQVDTALKYYAPTTVILCYGSDALNRYFPQTYFADIIAIIARCKALGVANFIISSPLPTNFYLPYIRICEQEKQLYEMEKWLCQTNGYKLARAWFPFLSKTNGADTIVNGDGTILKSIYSKCLANAVIPGSYATQTVNLTDTLNADQGSYPNWVLTGATYNANVLSGTTGNKANSPVWCRALAHKITYPAITNITLKYRDADTSFRRDLSEASIPFTTFTGSFKSVKMFYQIQYLWAGSATVSPVSFTVSSIDTTYIKYIGDRASDLPWRFNSCWISDSTQYYNSHTAHGAYANNDALYYMGDGAPYDTHTHILLFRVSFPFQTFTDTSLITTVKVAFREFRNPVHTNGVYRIHKCLTEWGMAKGAQQDVFASTGAIADTNYGVASDHSNRSILPATSGNASYLSPIAYQPSDSLDSVYTTFQQSNTWAGGGKFGAADMGPVVNSVVAKYGVAGNPYDTFNITSAIKSALASGFNGYYGFVIDYVNGTQDGPINWYAPWAGTADENKPFIEIKYATKAAASSGGGGRHGWGWWKWW